MLNEKDEQLLSILRSNARASISDLARALNVSRTAIQNRMTKLENNDVIKSYTVALGNSYTENQITVNVSLKVNPNLRKKVCISLRKIHQISQVYSISGEFDLLIILQIQSLKPLSNILDHMCNLDGVERTNSSIILDAIFER